MKRVSFSNVLDYVLGIKLPRKKKKRSQIYLRDNRKAIAGEDADEILKEFKAL